MSTRVARLTAAFVFGVVLSYLMFGLTGAEAQTGDYGHLHFTAGFCEQGDSASKGVIDTRNGNHWCLRSNGTAARYLGTLALADIPELAPR